LAANPGDILDYLEVVGKGQPFPHAPFPMIAVPTTAGTGSEVTRNAVLGSPEHGVKASLRSPLMLPRIAIVDPNLTLGLPPAITASTGLDALTQLIEPYVSGRANPVTDALCLDGIPVAARSLRKAFENGNDVSARAGMAYASLLGGLALANAGLGVVHGFAAPIGGMFEAPHGAVCAAILPFGIDANLQAMRARDPENPALNRYRRIAAILTDDPDAIPEDVVAWVRTLVRLLRIPPLANWGIAAKDVDGIAAKASQSSSMKANPVVLNTDELKCIMERSI
jgi:alcohol dehydrogenase class IV